MQNRKIILAIDGSNMAFRYLSIPNPSYPPLVSILNYISKLIIQLKPDEIFMAWEGYGSRNERCKLYPDYKANREEQAKKDNVKKVKEGMALLEYEIGKALPVRQLKIDHLEADDCLALLSRYYYTGDGNSAIILVSSDQDFLQLINDRIFVYNAQKNFLFTPKTFQEHYHIKNPNNYVWFKAIHGDSGDNIYGIKGVGPKTCEKLFADILNSEEEWSWDEVKKRMKIINKPYDENMIWIYHKIIQLQTCLSLNGLSNVTRILQSNFNYEFSDKEFFTIMESVHSTFPKYSSKMLGNISVAFNEFIVRKNIKKDLGDLSSYGSIT